MSEQSVKDKIEAAVRAEKAASPHLYCRYPGCLWRVLTQNGPNGCRKHGTFPERKEETK